MRIAILLLVACGPRIVSSTPRSITMTNVNAATVEEATRSAQYHCEQYGRDAELVPDSNPDGAATFKCVDDQEAIDARRAARSATAVKPVAATAPTQRGHFCAISTTVGLCARDKADCTAARDAAVAAVADLGECVLVETAHCFDVDGRERCFPTAEQCAPRGGPACSERK